MTIEELKQRLSMFPDDTEVVSVVTIHDNPFHSLTLKAPVVDAIIKVNEQGELEVRVIGETEVPKFKGVKK